MPYSIRLALQSLRHEKWINLLSMLTVAMGLMVVSLVLLLLYNVDLFARKLPERFSVIAYLKEDLSEQDIQQVIASVKGQRGVEKVRYISKAEAWRELKSTLKDADYIIEGVGENPLPPSIEIRLKREFVGPEAVKPFAAGLKKIPEIDDVQYGEKMLLSIQSVTTGVQTAGVALSAIMVSGITFICYSTVKILFYRRREEIETLKLLGATRSFIRLPFLVEGGILGTFGGGICLTIMLIFYYGVYAKLSAAAPLFNAVVFPSEILMALPLAGLLLGVTGAFIAIGRIRF